MAAKPSTAAEKTLQNVQDQVTCGICQGRCKEPKALNCSHVFCEQCFQTLVREGQEGESLACLQCNQETALPVGGVPGLQEADNQEPSKEVSSSNETTCNKCKKHEAVRFCRTCGLVCQLCIETHLESDDLATHEIIYLENLSGDKPALVPPPPPEKPLFCLRHRGQQVDNYCEKCEEVLCLDCVIDTHLYHEYDTVAKLFSKHQKAILDVLKPVKENIATLEASVELADVRSARVKEQKTAAVAEIRTAMGPLRQALEERETELVSRAEEVAEEKLKALAAQKEKFEQQLVESRSCRGFTEKSQHIYSKAEILRMKRPLVKQINLTADSTKPEPLALAEKVDLRFACHLPELTKTLQQFGKIYWSELCPEKSRASGEGIRAATRRQTTSFSVEALDGEGEAYLRPVDSLRCELVASDGSVQDKGAVEKSNGAIYEISYLPQVTGRYQLHVLVEDRPILNSPFTVTVLADFTAPAKVIGDVVRPWGIAFREGGEVVVAEWQGHCISIINASGEKTSFGTRGSAPGQFDRPTGVAIDAGGNILVADSGNHRIQQFSPTGEHLKTVGAKGSEPLQFKDPYSVLVHPRTQKVYVTEYTNHRVQILSSELAFSRNFGELGFAAKEFNHPHHVATDSEGTLYVADSYNDRVQVFTADGVYRREFGKKGEGEGELRQPSCIAIDSNNVVYVSELGNYRVSIFSSNGEFIKSFGGLALGSLGVFSLPCGLGVLENGTVYVCDTYHNCIKVFS